MAAAALLAQIGKSLSRAEGAVDIMIALLGAVAIQDDDGLWQQFSHA